MPKSSKKDIAECTETDSSVNSEKASLSGKNEKAGTGGVDQIRDLLFGTQMQDYENRFNRMEELVIDRITGLEGETGNTLSSLEKSIKKELDLLSDRLTEEKNERSQSMKDLSQELKSTSESILKTIHQLSDTTETHIEELRRQTQDQSESLRNELNENKEDISDALEKAVQKLRHDTIDRAAFASMLSDMADRIKNESTVPDPENMNDEK